jgi:hypothetical protein
MGMVVHICNLSYRGDKGRRVTVLVLPMQKSETPSEKKKKEKKKCETQSTFCLARENLARQQWLTPVMLAN